MQSSYLNFFLFLEANIIPLSHQKIPILCLQRACRLYFYNISLCTNQKSTKEDTTIPLVFVHFRQRTPHTSIVKSTFIFKKLLCNFSPNSFLNLITTLWYHFPTIFIRKKPPYKKYEGFFATNIYCMFHRILHHGHQFGNCNSFQWYFPKDPINPTLLP